MTTAKYEKVVDNCIDCPNHRVLSDRDPNDWFCDDDVAVVCGITKNPDNNARFKQRPVTVACRPYLVRKESDVPSWCPLKDDN